MVISPNAVAVTARSPPTVEVPRLIAPASTNVTSLPVTETAPPKLLSASPSVTSLPALDIVVVPPTVTTPLCVISPPAVQPKLRVTLCVPRITAPASLKVASCPLVTAAVPKLLLASLKVISLSAPVEVNVAVGATRVPLCVRPAPVAVKLVPTVNAFKSKAVVSNTDTFANVPAEATNVTVPVKLLPALLTLMF